MKTLPLLTIACLLPAVSLAQLEDLSPIEPLPPASARVVEVSSSVQRELAQIESLAEADAWDEAVDGMLRLVSETSEELVAISGDHYLPLDSACQLQMSLWPVDGLEVYRQRVDPTAQQLFAAATESRNSANLQRLIDEYFCSSVGDDALLAVADWSLEAGNFSRARGCLLRISPKLSRRLKRH